MGNKTITDCEGTHKVWTMDANGFTAHPVKIGLSDGSHTEILEGLNEGTPIVTETVYDVVTQKGMPIGGR